jgi:thymidylate synthase (FAD)
MSRLKVPAADEILGCEFKVLNHGFVRLIDYMGGDERIVQSARVSYGKGTKSLREDEGLIRYLLRNRHTSPFEQVVLTFHCKMPIFVARQWVRHRTARLNEISGRYSVMKDEFYVPGPDQVCYQNKDNKQGRSGPLPLDEAERIIQTMTEDQGLVYEHYSSLLDDNPTKSVARELARVNLPLSLYTEWYWQIDLHNLFHFLSLRLDPHAQYEIRVYAEIMAECAAAVAPIAYMAFEEHVLHAKTFSRSEVEVLKKLLAMDGATDIVLASLGKEAGKFVEKLTK